MSDFKLRVNDFLANVEEPSKGEFEILSVHNDHWIVKHNAKILRAKIKFFDTATKSYTIEIDSQLVKLQLLDQVDQLIENMGMNDAPTEELDKINAPMPGMIIDILVNVGDEIQKGDSIIIMEAMKMENVLKSNGAGIITSIEVKKGEKVEKDQLLIKF